MEVGIDEFDQAVDKPCCDLLVFLFEVVQISVEDLMGLALLHMHGIVFNYLDEKFHHHSSVDHGIANSQRSLEAFQHSLTVTVKLFDVRSNRVNHTNRTYRFRIFLI